MEQLADTARGLESWVHFLALLYILWVSPPVSLDLSFPISTSQGYCEAKYDSACKVLG